MKSDKQIIAELERVTAGLLVMSESDYPFEVVSWDGQISLTFDYLCSISDRPKDTTIEKPGLEAFLGRSERFREILAVLRNNLTEVEVYRIGTINISVWIVGRSAEGNWLGLSTRLIET